jgi:hypothetical protein
MRHACLGCLVSEILALRLSLLSEPSASGRSSWTVSWTDRPQWIVGEFGLDVSARTRNLSSPWRHGLLVDERCLRTHDAEFVSFGIGQYRPRLIAGLADVDPARAESDEPLYLRVPLFGGPGRRSEILSTGT